MPADSVLPDALELIPEGFTMLAFPSGLQADIRDTIVAYILSFDKETKSDHNADHLRDVVCAMGDDEFVSNFKKGFRTFPDVLAARLLPWVDSEIRTRLNANQITLTYVSEADRKTNASLSPKSYDVYWRIVRPNKPDVAGPHIDATFADLNVGSERAIPLPFDFTSRWRIWMPLMGCTSENSLQFIPGSQNEHFPATSRDTPYGPRPSVSEEWKQANEHRFVCPFTEFDGQCVLFSDKVVHRGPVNGEQGLRISAELTVIVR